MNIENKLPYIDDYIELIPDLVFIKNIEGEYIYFNKIFLDFLNKTREEVINKTDLQLFNPINANNFIKADEKILENGDIVRLEEIFIQSNGEYTYFNTSKEVIYNNKNEKVGLFCIARDITKQKEYEIIYEDNEKLLELIAIENNLEKSLNSIIFLAQKRNPETICSIILLDKEKKYLAKSFGPSLPDFYNKAIQGIEIGEKVGSCGAASYKKERVIVENINTHENWSGFLELTKKANLNACWSEPIISSNDEILGTFAIYNNKPKTPNNFELKLISSYANLASIAVKKEETHKALEDSNKRLQKSEILKKNILSSIPDLIWLKDNNGVYLSCNPKFELFFGAKEKEIIGKTDYDFVEKEVADSYRYYDKEAMKSKSALINEEWITYNTGETVLLETTKKALVNSEGEAIGVLGIGHDITKQNEQINELKNMMNLAKDLANQQDTLLSLFDKGDSVLLKWKNNTKSQVDYITPSIFKLTGYEKEDFLYQKITYSECIYKDDLQTVIKTISYALQHNLDYFKHKPYRIVTKEGNISWVLDYTVTQKDSRNNITHFISYISDITDQKNQQDIFFQQSKLASMGEMVSNIAHQWRQPLSIISTSASGLLLYKEANILTDELLIDNCNIINNNAQYLSKTIDDFRNFSSARREKNNFYISESIRGFLNLINSTSKQDNIIIITNLDDSLNYYGSANELIQCYMNIFSNTKDALASCTKQKYFFIESYLEDNTIHIKFKDNATGFSSEILKRVFEPYFTTKHQFHGTGLGLSMTYNLIVEGMNGSIKASNQRYTHDNKELSGAQIHISIPITKG